MRYVYSFAAMLTVIPIFGQGVADLSITNYKLAGEELRVSRTVSDFEYRADLVNRGPARTAITASVTSLTPSVQILRGSLRFPSVPANGQIAGNDTILIRVDRTVPFDFANLQWTFSAVEAPFAHAGPSQTVAVGATVILNGGASSSTIGGGALSYNWVFLSRPQGSLASLNNPSSVNPAFVADAAGAYTVQLTVTNSVGSSQAAVTISTLNSAPVANAGPNQSVAVGAAVQLNGSGSSDVDGDALTHSWTLLSRPPASTAALSGVSAVNPTFTADKAGTYTAQLIVNDGKVGSSPSTVAISTQNTIPVANPGTAQTVNTGAVVQLNGAGSTDVDGDTLTYQWSFNSVPAGSAAVLNGATAVNPSFTADRPGTYIVQLIVSDGKGISAAATVTISTNAVQAPTANAGANQTVKHGSAVALGGSGADPQSLPLTYLWSLTTKPPASGATLTTPAAANSGFAADRPGIYVAQLIVNNGYLNSPPATVSITTTNTAPVARPGTNQSAVAGSTVNLDGGASSDADGDAIGYSWSFTSKPAGSIATLSAPNSGSPSFVPDIAGVYVAQLIVNDAFTASEPATVSISVTSRGNIVLPANATVELGQSVSFPVSLSVAAPQGGVTIALLSGDPARVAVSPASVFIPQNAMVPAVQPQITGMGLGPVSISASAAGHPSAQTQARSTGTIAFVPPVLTIDGTETKNVTLTLSGPAPAGGVTFALTFSTPGVASGPTTATIVQNGLTVSIPVTGAGSGPVVLRATAPELADATVSVTVNRREILLPSGVVVLPGELAAFPVSLSVPAAEATFVALTSGDPLRLTVTVQNLLFNPGQTQPTTQPKVSGIATGPVTITATAIGINTVAATVQVGPGLNFSQANIKIGAAATENLLLTLSGIAPPGGLPVTLSSSNPAAATLPQTVIIAAGANTVSVPVTGVAPGATVIRAAAPGAGGASAGILVNSPPVANAGPNQIVPLGTAVQLNGGGSSDADNDPLTYTWTLLTRPPASTAALSGVSTVNPTFAADKAGTYTAQLIVNDGRVNSAPSTVVITTQNSTPVANPGTAQTVNVGTMVQLNGAGSTDLDGDTLTYQWSFNSVPAGSAAALSGATAVNPSFTADRPGDYAVQLIVSDGKAISAAAAVTISTNPVQAPTANAGVNQTLKHGTAVVLSGSGADPQSLPLTYLWSLTVKPPASGATLTTPAAANSGFTADKPGIYVAQLITRNGYVDSIPATVTITATNIAPVANAGSNQSAVAGSIVNLNGGASSDADGDVIGYSWSFTSKPAGSGATLSAPASVSPSFVPDIAGVYVARLIVSDAFTASEPVTVTILVANRGNVVLPANAAVELGRSVLFPISLSAAAPQGGVTVALLSSDPSRVGISPASVFIAQDETVPAVQPQLTGTGLGPVLIGGSASGYAGAQAQARGTATIGFIPATLTMDENEVKNATLTLSGPAPVGGVTFALTFSNPGVASGPATVTILQNQTTAGIPVTAVTPGTAILRATAPELADATMSITVNRRDILLPSGVAVPPGELAAFPVSLASPALEATFVELTSGDPSKVALSVQYLLFNQGQTQPTAQPKVIGMGAGTATITATAFGLNTAVTNVLTGFSLHFMEPNLAITGTVTENMLLILSGPPPPAGLTVTLNSSNPAAAAVPQTIFIGAGTNTVNVPVTGIGTGSAIIRATAPDTGEAAAGVTVTTSGAGSIMLPASTIMQGQTVPYAVTLSQPAPAGGITITLGSGDPGTVTIAPSALTIAGGQTQPAVQAQITGAGVGSAAITASAPGYTSVSRTVQVNAVPTQIIVFSGTPQSATVGGNFAAPLIAVVRDTSGNSVPGVAVTFNAPSSGPGGTFQNGQTAATTNASGFATSAAFIANGSAGTYTVTASVAGVSNPAVFTLTNLSANPGDGGIGITNATVGRDLQAPLTVTLSRPAPAGGLRIDLISADPTVVLVAGRPTDAGLPRIAFTIGEGLSVVTGIYVHGLQSGGAASVTASASGWNSGTAIITMAPSGFVLTGPNALTRQAVTVGQGSSAVLTVSPARLDASLNFIEAQALRGAASVTVTLTNSTPSLGSLAPGSVMLNGGDVSAAATFTAALSASGSTVLAAAVPSGFSRPGGGGDAVTATVAAATVIASAVAVGENLQTASSIRLTSPAPIGGIPITVTSNDPAKVLLSLSPAAAGVSSISFQIPAGRTTSQEFYVQGLANGGQTAYAVSGAGVGGATGVVTLARSGFVLSGPSGIGVDFFTTTGAESTVLSVTPARLDASLNFVETQQIRGGLTVDVAATSSDTAVGTLAGLPIQFTGGSISGTAEFRPAGTGATTLALTTPPGFAVPAGGSALTATVRAPGMVLGDGLTIGNNLQSIATILIGQTAPAGGLLVTLTSNSPLLTLSATGTGAGSNSIALTIPAGGTSANYYLQAKGSSGEATYTAGAPGFAAKSATVRLAPSGVVIAGPFGFGYQMLAPINGGPQPASVMTGALDPVTGAFLATQPLAGGLSLNITLANGDSLIGTIPASVTLTGGSFSAVAQFLPLAPGSALISVETPAGYSLSPFPTLFVTVTE